MRKEQDWGDYVPAKRSGHLARSWDRSARNAQSRGVLFAFLLGRDRWISLDEELVNDPFFFDELKTGLLG